MKKTILTVGAKIMSSYRAVWIAAVCSMIVPMFASAATLTHRWSFASDYTDSVGGSTGTTIGENVSFAVLIR